jgi:hypothetical protein
MRAGAVLVAAGILLAGGSSRAQPDDGDLVWAGVGLSLPTYVLGVTVHEGSHALAAKMVGAEVLSMTILPGRDPTTGAFHFGFTRVRGLDCDRERIFFLSAPKITDTLLLGGFTALVFSDAWPGNRYGQLALTVLATGFWVDFSKDVFAFRKSNDVVKVMNLAGWRSEWQRLPVRLLYAGVAAGFGYAVWRGFDRTFGEADPAAARFIAPLLSGSF